MPEQHEIELAWILARHFNTVVEFLRPIEGYRLKTADLVINGQIWEMKSPTGRGRTTVSNQFKRASKQSSHVVFDARRIQLSEDAVLEQVRKECTRRKSIKEVLFVTKGEIVMAVN
jgi:hypothetical protein